MFDASQYECAGQCVKWSYTSIYATQFWVYGFQQNANARQESRVSLLNPIQIDLLLIAKHLHEQLLLTRHVQLLVDMGDVLVLVFFGIVPVCCTYYVEVPSVTWEELYPVFLMSIGCGFVVDTLLIVNNYRDIDNDRRAGKKTLAVLIGKKPMLALYIILPLIAVCVTVFVSERNDVWTYCYIGFMSSFFGASFANILRIGEGRALNKVLGDTACNIFIYGLLTSLYIIL